MKSNIYKNSGYTRLNEEIFLKLKNNYKYKLINIIGLIIFILLLINLFILKKKTKIIISELNNILKNEEKKSYIITIKYFNNHIKDYENYYKFFRKEMTLPHLKQISQRMTFEKRLPLPKKIKCTPHIHGKELVAFLSFLTKDTIFYETGSGCSSIIAKYYAKKTFAVEGCKKYYEIGIKNGLKENLIYKDLKTDNPTWSFPGRKSNLEDWKNYFQAYQKEYNADVILIDGRFKIATAMDIFNKIRNDTIVLLHEYNQRPKYYILESYYKYIYHWGTLFAFIKKEKINDIPIEIQKKYWEIPL